MATNNGLNINTLNPLSPLLGGTGSSSAEPVDEQVQQGQFNFATSTGAADAYVVTLTPAVGALTDGLQVVMTANHTNTTSVPTLAVNGLAAVNIVLEQGIALLDGDIVANSTYVLVYNLSNNRFQLVNPTVSTANSSLVQANSYSFALDTGVTNAYVATLNPVPPAPLTPGQIVYLEVDNTNSGASTFVLNGSAPTAIVTNVGTPLVPGDMVNNGLSILVYSGSQSAWVLINPSVTLGTGTVNAGTVNQIAYYAGNGNAVSGTTSLPSGTTLNGNPISTGFSSTFTPVLEINGSSAGIITPIQDGKYSVVGGVLTFVLAMTITSKGVSVGNLVMTGFPVAARGTPGFYFFNLQILNGLALPAFSVGSMVSNSTSAQLQYQSPTTLIQLSNANLTNTSEIYMSGSYLV